MKDLKDISAALDLLKSKGFRIEQGKGSHVKIFPPNRNLPFYTASLGDRTFHPLRRFARNHWGIELE